MYAEVSVNSPVAQRRAFSYTIPSNLDIALGQAVWVPFGDKTLQGIVLEISDQPAVEETREISGIIDPVPLLSPERIELAYWISGYYLSPLFDAVALMLSPGFERKVLTFISSPPDPKAETGALTPEQRQILHLLDSEGKVSLKKLEKGFGASRARSAVMPLVNKGLAVKTYELEKIKVRPKLVPYISLKISPAEAKREAESLKAKNKALRQASLLEYLADKTQAVPLSEAKKSTGCTSPVAKALADKGFIDIEQVEVRREPISYAGITPSSPLKLTDAQSAALEAIRVSLYNGRKEKPDVFLLHGVTGSGKTEVYLQALAEAVKRGKKAIVLVPEISLTPQTIERFAARFPHKVAVMHSGLSLGEQFDEWQRIRSGEFDVVIGSRSAIFAPQPDLGLIVIDEEPEWTYKQADKSPRYHARDVAIKLAELSGATVVLGSATPDVASFYHAKEGDYSLLELPERVTPSAGSPLPGASVVDLREELKAGNAGLFSRLLSQAINKALLKREQVILFLNRRGASSFIQCRNCGFVMRCPRCDVPLTYHLNDDKLVCHQCNYKMPLPQVCPQCLSKRIKFLGVGTQRLEREVAFNFPQAKLLRWDSDVTRGRRSHDEILSKFRNHKADILIGTQMIAKGLDLPLVTLVGVINADTALNLPDFRAGERTFQLISQVAGRAGRGKRGGEVVIQTYAPEHYAIKAASRHDYEAFYEKEIDYRLKLRNPPFTHLARLIYSSTNDAFCQREAEKMKKRLDQEIDSKGLDDIELIGPAPAFIHRLRGRFRWQIILRGHNLSEFLSPIPLPPGWTVDIDPASLV